MPKYSEESSRGRRIARLALAASTLCLTMPAWAQDTRSGATVASYEDVPAITGTEYLSNTIFRTGTRVGGYRIDGLSGIDYDRSTNRFVTVRDNFFQDGGPNDGTPPYFTVRPVFEAGKPGYSFEFESVAPLSRPGWSPDMNQLESVRFDPSGNGLWFSSEQPHAIYNVLSDGTRRRLVLGDDVVGGFDRGNANFGLEGLTFTPNGDLWAARENAQVGDSGNLTRITRLNADGSVAAQYAYRLDNVIAANNGGRPIATPPGGGVGNNGVSEILAIGDTSFLVMERGFDGRGAATQPTGESHNYIRIYCISIDGATDVKDMNGLSENNAAMVTPTKTLVFDSTTLADTLNTYDTKIDNIEGMSLGPVLANGHATLVLVSDNNGSSAQRKTQFIVLKIVSPIPDIQYWDGATPMADGRAGGGNGTWSAAKSAENWTRTSGALNDAWNGKTAVFGGTGGTVTIDTSAGAVGAGALRIMESGYRFTGGPLTIRSSGTTIDIAPTIVTTLAMGLEGSGRFTKTGAGTLLMTGDAGAFRGDTRVEQGILHIDGRLGGTIRVNGGLLTGSGTLQSVTVGQGGTVAPSGTLTITGDLLFEAGSRYAVEVDPLGTGSDLLAVGGRATLAGTVAHVGAAGRYRPRSTYTILTATGGIDGRFDGVTSDYAFLAPRLAYSANAVTMTLLRNDIRFDGIGATANQRSVGRAAETLGFDNPVYDAVVELGTTEARAAFISLSGELHPSITAMLVEDSRFVRNAALERVRRADDAPGTAIWGQAIGAWGHLGAMAGTARLERQAFGGVAGIEGVSVDGDVRLGVTGSYQHDDLSGTGDADADSWQGGIYGGVTFGRVTVAGGAALTWHQISADRTAVYGTRGERLRLRRNGAGAQAFGEAAYDVPVAAGSVSPFANIAHVALSMERSAERGGDAALVLPAQDTQVTFTAVGLRADQTLPLAGGRLSLHSSLGWRHGFGDRVPRQEALLQSAGFTAVGAGLARDALSVQVATGADLASGVRLEAGYTGELARRNQDHSMTATLSIRL